MSSDVLVAISALAYGGAGVGEVVDGPYAGLKVFVPYTSPGEVASVTLRKVKKRYAFGELKELVKEASDRTAPLCRHYGQCGGCELQHITYQNERKSKEEMVVSSFERVGISTPPLESTVSGSPYRYRRRIKLHLNTSGSLGYHRRGSNHIVSIQECPIAIESLENILKHLSQQPFPQGYVATLMIESDGEKVVVTCKVKRGSSTNLASLTRFLKKQFSHLHVWSQGAVVFTQGSPTLTLPSREGSIEVPAGAFSQSNWEVNRHLVDYVVAQVSSTIKSGRIADLYGGAGNFGLPLARCGFEVVSVELSPTLCEYATAQAIEADLSSCFTSIAGDVTTFLQQGKETFDLIVADPPREGLKAVLPYLPQSQHLVAVFCELPSAVRDVQALVTSGWSLERIKLFDMFPRTSRVELAVTLTRE
jgi:23S rRNA (uracil1939-C5)-methyltransferase